MKLNWNPPIPRTFELINQSLEIQPDGNPLFKDIQLTKSKPAIYSSLSGLFESVTDIDEDELKGIIDTAIFDLARIEHKVDPLKVLTRIKELIIEYRRSPKNAYHIAFQVSLPKLEEEISINHGRNRLTIKRSAPSKYSYSSIIRENRSYLVVDTPKGYSFAVLKVYGKNPYNAFTNGMQSAHYLLGLINYCINIQKSFFFTKSEMYPINNVNMGPLISVHFPNGKLAMEQVGINLNYLKEDDFYLPKKKDVPTIFKIAKQYKVSVERSRWKEFLRETFIRYDKILGNIDRQSSFIQMWALLEHLTWTKRDSYDTTVKRALIFSNSDEENESELNHFRKIRNDYVHLIKESSRISTSLWHLEQYVKKLILLYVDFGSYFSTSEEIQYFMDMPISGIKLGIKEKDNLRNLNLIRKFRTFRNKIRVK